MSFSQSFRELNDWANTVPPITRFLVFGTVVLSLAAQFGICHPRQLILSFPHIYTKYEIWRLVTCHLFSRGQAIIWHLIMLYQQSISLEQGYFSSKPYEYAWTIILIMAVLDVIGVYMSLPILTDTFGLAVTTVYSLVKGNEVVSFMFGLQFKAIFLPWVLLLWNVIMGGDPVIALIGIAAGYIVEYALIKFPAQNNGRVILPAPWFLKNWLPPPTGIHGFQGFQGQAPPQARPTTRTAWGTGYRLGSE